MDANRSNKVAIFFLLAFFSAPSLGGSPSATEGDAEILKILEDSFAGSLVNLERTIDKCSQIAHNRPPILIEFDDRKTKKDDLILAVSHFYFKNMLECEKEARSATAFDLAMLISFKETLNIPAEHLKQTQHKLVLQPFEQIGYQVKYDYLDSDLKNHLSKKLNGEPFELLKVLDANGLSRK